MTKYAFQSILLIALLTTPAWSGGLLIPMDAESQTDHLKAYGVTYWALEEPRGFEAEWLLNYRDGSFLIFDQDDVVRREAAMRGVTSIPISDAEISSIYAEIEINNMDRIPLERAPRIAVYAPPTNDPWDDAVTLALTYAQIPYDVIWEAEILGGDLFEYDWLHLHHEDFTGQFGKFYRTFRNAAWYQEMVRKYEQAARDAGFNKVQEHKGAVAWMIREYVRRGGFLFAMCAATDTLDIALSAIGLDIVESEIDGDGTTPGFQEKLNFDVTLAFRDFVLIPNPLFTNSPISIPAPIQ